MKKKQLSVSTVVALLILLSIVVIGGFQLLKPTFNSTEITEPVAKKTIEYNGKKYFPRQDITTILVMGADEFGPREDSGYYLNNYEADVVMLVVLDEQSEKFNIISLNRDTMVEMPILGVGGKKAGTLYQQLALAHTYGSGLEDSAENVKETVSSLFKNIYIDYYVSVNMDAISIITDAVNGVKVDVSDDFSLVDNTIEKGEVLLTGEQAISFVRLRKDVGDQLNISRMERQKQFLNGLFNAAKSKLESGDSFIRNTYSELSPYMVTDISVSSASALLNRYSEYEMGEILIPRGENVKGKEFMEFYLHEDEFDKLVIDNFYIEK